MTPVLILLILVGPFLVAAPGALFAAVQAPEFFTGRRPQSRPRLVVRRWAVA
jgi:hypothetical protein